MWPSSRRDRVLLAEQARHPEGVVHLEVRHAGLVVRAATRGHERQLDRRVLGDHQHVREDDRLALAVGGRHVLVGVLEPPPPLVALHGDLHRRRVADVELPDHRDGGHHHDREHHGRRDRPADLEAAVPVGLRGDPVAALAVAEPERDQDEPAFDEHEHAGRDPAGSGRAGPSAAGPRVRPGPTCPGGHRSNRRRAAGRPPRGRTPRSASSARRPFHRADTRRTARARGRGRPGGIYHRLPRGPRRAPHVA